MIIKLVLYNILYLYEDVPEKEVKEVEITSSTTMFDLLEIADVSNYYPLSGEYSFNNQYLPFVLSGSILRVDVPYSEAKVIDFINTHHIDNFTIEAYTGYPQAGGPGFIELLEVWNQIYPIIDQFATLLGIVTFAGTTGKWLYSLMHKKPSQPQTYFDLLYSRKSWNHHELASLLEISSEKAKKLLALFDYKYENKTKLYIQQPDSLILREKLSKINVHDIN